MNSIIGRHTYIGDYSVINDSTIGSFCSIADFVRIGHYNHYIKHVSSHPFLNHKQYGFVKNDFFTDENVNETRKEVLVGNDVWLGTGVVVLRGVQIGDGAVVGANSVVTRNIPPYSIVGGIPARIMKYRFDDETIEKLLQIGWWNWEEERIKRNIQYFYDVNRFVDKFT